MARKEKSIHYIYKTTCNVTGRYYIGMHSTNNLEDCYMGSGTRLRRSLRKYGVEQHTKEILEYCNSRELLIEREIAIVTNELIDDDLCINLKCGGEGGFISEEQQKHRSECGGKAFAEKLKTDEKFKLEWTAKMVNGLKDSYFNGKKDRNWGKDWTNNKHSEETKILMSQSSKGMGVGENNSQFGTCWITRDGLNKKIKKEDLNNYINEGWYKGRKF